MARPPSSRATHARRPGTLDELAERRGRMNPRLEREWLRYLVSVGAREDADGWRWKIDPTLRFGGFGPWQPGVVDDAPARHRRPRAGGARRGSRPDGLGHPGGGRPLAPAARGRLVVLDGVGHFVHIEQPRMVADLVLEFLGVTTVRAPPQQVELALHELRAATAARSCCCTGWASGRRPRCPPTWPTWPGPVWGLDFTGHGDSSARWVAATSPRS